MEMLEILNRVQSGSLNAEQAKELLAQRTVPSKERKPPHFKVAEKSGWCSVYFDGLRRPCTLPSKLWLELFEEENMARLVSFLKTNEAYFRNK